MIINIFNLVMELGYDTVDSESNFTIADIVRKGMTELETLIDEGKCKLIYIDGKKYVEVDDLYQLPTRKPVYQDTPKGFSKKRNLMFSLKEDGVSYKAVPLVKQTYLFKQSLQPASCLDVIAKLNAIPFKIEGWSLNFERTNKSIKHSNEEWLIETQAMRESVEENLRATIYFGWTFDKRGRIYSDGKLLNWQGDEWNKATLSPQIKPEELTAEGMRQMKIDIANHYGYDKANYDVREAFIAKQDDVAKKPILANKAVSIWNRLVDDDSFMTNYCVGIDATASGMQILSILSNDSETAKYTNLTDPSRCYDIYGKACEKVLEVAKSSLSVKDIRDIIKKALMTRGYNSDKQIVVAQQELRKKGISIDLSTLTSILDLSDKITKAKDAMNNVLCDTYSKLSDDQQITRWTMPDGFIVEIANISKCWSGFTCRKFSLQMTYDRLGWNKELNWRALAPNLIHSIDAYICREVIRRCSFQVVPIHDCFYTHPNHVLELRRTYIKVLREVQAMNMLEYICKQINPDFSYKPEGELFEIADDDNSYCLC